MPVTPADVQAAAERLDGVAHRTPVVSSSTLDERVGARVLLKAESLQRGGAFKFRGAYNAIASLQADERRRGVVAYSSGNHAQAVALAASLLGVRAVILMPTDAPPTKLAATRGYGAEVREYDRYADSREELAAAVVEQEDLTLVPPFDHPAVIAGQGTVALELLDDVHGLDVLVTPVGGGGLLSGCAVWARSRRPDIRIVGVEPEEGDDVRQSLAAGKRVSIPVPRTIADGLQTTSPGVHTLELLRRANAEIMTVSDAELVAAMVFLHERLKLVVEPSGAAAVAALLAGRIGVTGLTVGAVLSGGNVGAARFAELLAVDSAASRSS